MDAKLNRRIELFDENNKLIMKKYWLKNTRLQVLAGFILSCSDMQADTAVLDNCREVLSRYFGFLSSARDNLELPLMASMAVSGDPEAYAAKFKYTYECVKKGTVLSGDFEMLAAMVLMDAPMEKIEGLAERMKSIYKKMGKNHPWLTSAEDKSSAAILTLAEKDEDALLDDMEQCFGLLKQRFKLKGEQLQSMSALLAAQEGAPAAKVAKTIELCDKLKANKMNLNMSMALPIVAGLAAMENSTDAIIEGVKEAAEALKGKSGFGAFGLGAEGRTIYGIINYLAAAGNAGDTARTLAQNQVMSVIIQEVILMMIIMTNAQMTATNNS